jgi:hypothetical protein
MIPMDSGIAIYARFESMPDNTENMSFIFTIGTTKKYSDTYVRKEETLMHRCMKSITAVVCATMCYA